jgi:hypothetical protein
MGFSTQHGIRRECVFALAMTSHRLLIRDRLESRKALGQAILNVLLQRIGGPDLKSQGASKIRQFEPGMYFNDYDLKEGGANPIINHSPRHNPGAEMVGARTRCGAGRSGDRVDLVEATTSLEAPETRRDQELAIASRRTNVQDDFRVAALRCAAWLYGGDDHGSRGRMPLRQHPCAPAALRASGTHSGANLHLLILPQPQPPHDLGPGRIARTLC